MKKYEIRKIYIAMALTIGNFGFGHPVRKSGTNTFFISGLGESFIVHNVPAFVAHRYPDSVGQQLTIDVLKSTIENELMANDIAEEFKMWFNDPIINHKEKVIEIWPDLKDLIECVDSVILEMFA